MKIMAVFGTRPEAIKMAPLVKALKREKEFATLVAVTAQHREMLDQVLSLFQIRPDFDLNLMRHRQTLTRVTAGVLEGMGTILEKERPDLVLVHGDTTTTFAAALAAFYRQIPVGHVEAGLRTGNKYSPYPEEMNRHLTGALADLHFAPTATARENLLRENVDPAHIYVTGNTVIDALLATVEQDYRFPANLARVDFSKRVLLVTAHRRENWGSPMERIFAAVRSLVERFPDVELVFPVHKNPTVRQLAYRILGEVARVHLIEPLDYQPFVNLMNRCYLVLTDSGGMQEEAPSLGKPVLVLRDTTERPEAVAAGTVRLVGTDPQKIIDAATQLLQNSAAYREMANAVNPYGDGLASRRIIQAVRYWAGIRQEPPEQFIP